MRETRYKIQDLLIFSGLALPNRSGDSCTERWPVEVAGLFFRLCTKVFSPVFSPYLKGLKKYRCYDFTLDRSTDQRTRRTAHLKSLEEVGNTTGTVWVHCKTAMRK